VATGVAAKAAPDGHTALAVTTALVINPALYGKLPYHPVRDFAPITIVGTSPHVMVVHPALPVSDVRELVRLVKANPGKYHYASPGTGQSGQLAGEMFRAAAQLDLVHIPFNGASPAITATIAGHTQIAFMSLAAAAPAIKDGKLRPLAVTSAKRSEVLSNIPTMTEMGIADQESGFWQGIVLPAGTPPEIVSRWHRDVVDITMLPDVRNRLRAMSFDLVASTPAEFTDLIKAEMSKWRNVVHGASMKKLDE
jgi:tripartite-type tricarboxylate transporter receptor subunit TctC